MTPFYTRATLAEELKLSIKTIDRYREKRELPFYLFGRQVRFNYEDVLTFLDSHEVGHRQSQGQYRA